MANLALCSLRAGLALAAAALCAPAQAIVGGTATTGFGQVSNGVQITENWVLSAHHLGFGVGSHYGNGYGVATVAAVYNASGAAFPDNDLTLLRLATPITAPGLSLLADRLPDGLLATPLDVTIATGANQVPRGYGQTQLRAVAAQIDPDDAGPLGPVTVNYLITYGAGFGGPRVQGGDSGGGLFLGAVTDSVSPLLGITSAHLTFDAAGLQQASGFVQLAAYRGWIDATLATDLADAQTAQWVSAVPEPGTAALALAGGLWLAGTARRRRCASLA